MQKSLILSSLLLLGVVMLAKVACCASTPASVLENIHWFGQAAVKIQAGETTIYIDPLQLEQTDPADIVLITHPHDDHLSVADMTKVADDQTVFIAPSACAEKVKQVAKTDMIVAEPGQTLTVGAIQIEVVPAYNVVKTKFHAKENHWVGYILTLDGVRVYHTGDTERIPEMKNIRADIMLLPLGQTYTMNSVQEAADAVLDVQAKIAIPIHYGLYEGTAADAQAFSAALQDKLQVVIKPNE